MKSVDSQSRPERSRAMKEVKIDEAIRKDPKLLSAIEHATKALEEEIGPASSTVTAEWTLSGANQQLPLIGLEISDGIDSARQQFQRTMIERKPDSSLRIHFIRMWGDLLQERSHRQMKRLNLIIQELETT
jgi:hypothetical protein